MLSRLVAPLMAIAVLTSPAFAQTDPTGQDQTAQVDALFEALALPEMIGIMREEGIAYGDQIANELIQTRCHRGADIARQLRFSDDVADGILSLDEHWNGKGRALQLAGEAIPLFSRIALLCQVVDVFHAAAGPDAALPTMRTAEKRPFSQEAIIPTPRLPCLLQRHFAAAAAAGR